MAASNFSALSFCAWQAFFRDSWTFSAFFVKDEIWWFKSVISIFCSARVLSRDYKKDGGVLHYSAFSRTYLQSDKVPAAEQSVGCFQPPYSSVAPADEHESSPQTWSNSRHFLFSPAKNNMHQCCYLRMQNSVTHLLIKSSAVRTCSSLRSSISSSTFLSAAVTSLLKHF